jgi:hypothetical protein
MNYLIKTIEQTLRVNSQVEILHLTQPDKIDKFKKRHEKFI